MTGAGNSPYQLFSNLSGIEIGQDAVDLMKETFPEMYKNSKIEVGNAPELLLKHDTRKYKLVFCHSVLVNIPTNFNYVFREMARVSSKYIITLENEASFNAYPRNFQKKFESEGFKMVTYKYYTPKKDGGLNIPNHWTANDMLTNNVLRIFVRK